MSLKSLVDALDLLWQSEYVKGITSQKATSLAIQIQTLRNSASPREVSQMYKVLMRHDACISLDTIANQEWWQTIYYRELYFSLDAVADSYNSEIKVPIPIWTHVKGMLDVYNGTETECTWEMPRH